MPMLKLPPLHMPAEGMCRLGVVALQTRAAGNCRFAPKLVRFGR